MKSIQESVQIIPHKEFPPNTENYYIKSCFNGSTLSLSLTYYINDVITVYQGQFTEDTVNNQGLIIHYGSWQNVYLKCFKNKEEYRVINSNEQGETKIIQIPYQIQEGKQLKLLWKNYAFQLKLLTLSKEQQIIKLKEVIQRKQVEKMNTVRKFVELKKKMQDKQTKINQLNIQLHQIEQLCQNGSIPLYKKTQSFLTNAATNKNPNQLFFTPKSPTIKYCHVLLKNPIPAQTPLTITINFQTVMRNQNHSMGIVLQQDQLDIQKSDNKIVYEFKGEIWYGNRNCIKCTEMINLRYTELQMKIDLVAGEVMFKTGSQVFAGVNLKALKGKAITPFLKIGQIGFKYNVHVF